MTVLWDNLVDIVTLELLLLQNKPLIELTLIAFILLTEV